MTYKHDGTRWLGSLILVCVLCLSWRPAPVAAQDEAAAAERFYTHTMYVVVLASERGFEAALRKAKAVGRHTGVPFSMQGMVYDPKRGLILPDDDPDPIYAGTYVGRRYNVARLEETGTESEFLSVERSEAYTGFAKGYYIVVGGIYATRGDAKQSLAKFIPFVPDAYAKQTAIYYGCMH